MGGRGSGSRLTATQPNNPQNSTNPVGPQTQMQMQPPAQPQPQQPTPQPGNTLHSTAQASATLQSIMAMTDDDLATAVIAAKNVDMPNFLNDASDITQKFVYQVGLNGAPTVLDDNAFDAFMKQNGIPQSQVLSRGVSSNGAYSAQQIANVFRYSEMNYIGGKHGGAASGAGAYFDMNGGGSTGYGGGALLTAVLNPATARVVDYYDLQSKAQGFARSHPKFAAAIGAPRQSWSGGNISVYALAMGYNVISGGPVQSSYHCIIDRSAVVVKA